MIASLSRLDRVRRVTLVIPFLLVGLGACRVLLGIDDPGPDLGPEADAMPKDGALPTDGPAAPDALTDARVDIDDGGLDGGPCRELVAESFTGASVLSYSGHTDQDGGLEVVVNDGVRVTVGTGTGQAHFAYIKFGDLRAGAWTTAVLKVDLTLHEVGALDAAAGTAVTDTLISIVSGEKGLAVQRRTIANSKTIFHFFDRPSDQFEIPSSERVGLTYTFASATGDASVGRIVVTRMIGSAEVPDPQSRQLAPPLPDAGIELSIGALGVSAPPPPALSYTIHRVTLCVQ